MSKSIKRIAFDLTALLPEITGVDQYMIQLVLNLGKVDNQNHYRLYINWEDRNRLKGLLPENFHFVPLSTRHRPIRFLFQQIILPIAAALWGADVLHSPSFFMPMMRGGCRHVITVHDMTSFTLPERHTGLRRSLPYRKLILWSIQRAHLIIVPSRSTRDDIYQCVPDIPKAKVRVILSGIGEEFRIYPRSVAHSTLERLGLPATTYILYVGTIEPRKNLMFLIEAYKQLARKNKIIEPLVLAGGLGWDYKELLEQIQSPELRHKIHMTGYVQQNELPMVYAGASLFVYPSLNEGFGFPPLEAMACGVPTISTDTSSLKENLHGAAKLVSPNDVESLIEAMQLLLNDKASREHYQQAGLVRAAKFRWEETARQSLACYQELAERRNV